MVKLNVELGPASYDIHIGTDCLCMIGDLVSAMSFSRKALIVTDDNVNNLYGSRVLEYFQASGFTASIYSVSPGESAKSADNAMNIFTKAIELQLDRKSPIIALGGGVVGDLAGFVAATYLRGVPFIQIPTTLLAQVDSSVGGKVAINHELGKNLIGAFYQPKLVLIDTKLLETLPDRELYTGLAEVMKYGIIAEKEFFDYLEGNAPAILERNNDILSEIIYTSCRIKADVVGKDEREAGLRAILNFGHTIAHGIEAYTHYRKYNHGEAVAIGMHGATLISKYLGLCPPKTADDISRLITTFKLPLTAKDCPAEAIFPLLSRDKKAVNGKIKWVLVSEIGRVLLESSVPETIIQQALAEIT